jgi:hypothetical protein
MTRSPHASIVLTFHAFFLCCLLGHTGTSAIFSAEQVDSKGGRFDFNIVVEPRVTFLRLPFIFGLPPSYQGEVY